MHDKLNKFSRYCYEQTNGKTIIIHVSRGLSTRISANLARWAIDTKQSIADLKVFGLTFVEASAGLNPQVHGVYVAGVYSESLTQIFKYEMS